MKQIYVSKKMKPYVQFVMERDKIPFEFSTNKKGYVLSFNGSNKDFTEVLEDALCEKQREESNSTIPVYSYNTLKNEKKRNRLMKLNRRKGFVVLRSDIKKVRQHCM